MQYHNGENVLTHLLLKLQVQLISLRHPRVHIHLAAHNNFALYLPFLPPLMSSITIFYERRRYYARDWRKVRWQHKVGSYVRTWL